MPKYVLGIHCTVHDSAACLIRDGAVVAAVEEERFTRDKHTGQFPRHAIDFCLRMGGVKVRELQAVAVSYKPWRVLKNAMFHAAGSSLRRPAIAERVRFLYTESRVALPLFCITTRLRQLYGSPLPRVRYVDHHLAHAVGAFLSSPYESAAILTIDGYGEDTSTLLAEGHGMIVNELGRINFPSSIGLLYNAVTAYLGFNVDCDEGKVMGLAAHGEPCYIDAFRGILQAVGSWRFRSDLRYLDHSAQRVSRAFVDTFGPPRRPGEPIDKRHKDVAASLQLTTEEQCLRLAAHLRRQTRRRALCLAGGVALNCTMNGKVASSGLFDSVFIHPAPGDSGTAMGAAAYVHNELSGGRGFRSPLQHAYLGPAYPPDAIRRVVVDSGLEHSYVEDVAASAARLLQQGCIIGWFQGGLEYGPRALGNRSILADARRSEVKKRLDVEIKFREDFRPYAPAILSEAVNDYFDCAVPSPFMNFSCRVKPERAYEIPAVVHVDSTARLQTVTRSDNPLFWRLLSEYRRLTRMPMLLNTSFNTCGEPIVNTPDDAMRSFRRTGLDCLVMGNYILISPQKGAGDGYSADHNRE